MRNLKLIVCVVLSLASTSSFAATFQGAAAFVSIGTSISSPTINSIPYVTPITISNANGSSTVTPDFTGLVFKTSFSQTITSGTFEAVGKTDVNFAADAGDIYSLFGSTAPVTGVGMLEVTLFDNTTLATVYRAVTGSTTIGNATGSLTGGDIYNFLLSDTLDVSQTGAVTNSVALPPATNTGSGGITIFPGLSVPEPAAAGTVMVLVGGVLPALGRKRHRQGSSQTT